VPLAYSHSFRTPGGHLVYVPTPYGLERGHAITEQVLARWKPPSQFFHFRRGGHVAACRYHCVDSLFARLDIQSFFDSVTRTKVHRALRRIRIPQEEAVEITRVSTVERVSRPGTFALPFGFVQSMVLASVALDLSAVGKLLRTRHQYGVRVSVYVDDILLSAVQADQLDEFIADLRQAGAASGYQFNAAKMSPPSEMAEAFNIIVSNSDMRVNARRMADFEGVVRDGALNTAAAVIRYVGSVNRTQAKFLGDVNGSGAE
jgi:Reverse transcriptase (RNA-dependent DNA polymerase)